MQNDALSKTPTDALAELRGEIDRIDLAMHRLLMQRGEIIDRLIEVKRTQCAGPGGGCAFRPDREAQMMRALVERHHGLLPLDAVEGIWRVIVSTFTFVQAPYSVHADDSGGDAQMRDSARFHFGFTVPYVPHHGAVAVIDAVSASSGDLGVLRSLGGSGDGAWWLRLVGERAPKIIARLPFVERPDHPAGLPVFVVAKPPPIFTRRTSRSIRCRCRAGRMTCRRRSRRRRARFSPARPKAAAMRCWSPRPPKTHPQRPAPSDCWTS